MRDLHPYHDFEAVSDGTVRTRWDIMNAARVVCRGWGDGTYYIWQTSDGRYWRGGNWYPPKRSAVYEVCPVVLSGTIPSRVRERPRFEDSEPTPRLYQ